MRGAGARHGHGAGEGGGSEPQHSLQPCRQATGYGRAPAPGAAGCGTGGESGNGRSGLLSARERRDGRDGASRRGMRVPSSGGCALRFSRLWEVQKLAALREPLPPGVPVPAALPFPRQEWELRARRQRRAPRALPCPAVLYLPCPARGAVGARGAWAAPCPQSGLRAGASVARRTRCKGAPRELVLPFFFRCLEHLNFEETCLGAMRPSEKI